MKIKILSRPPTYEFLTFNTLLSIKSESKVIKNYLIKIQNSLYSTGGIVYKYSRRNSERKANTLFTWLIVNSITYLFFKYFSVCYL